MAILEKIKANGDIPVPAPMLKKVGLKPGAEVILHTEEKSIIIEKPRKKVKSIESIRRLRGCLKHIDFDAVRKELNKRWGSWKRTPCV